MAAFYKAVVLLADSGYTKSGVVEVSNEYRMLHGVRDRTPHLPRRPRAMQSSCNEE